MLIDGGTMNLDNGTASNANFDNFSDIFMGNSTSVSMIHITNGAFNHNTGDIWMYSDAMIELEGASFNNRSVIRDISPSSCIRFVDNGSGGGGNFGNLFGGVVIGTGGAVFCYWKH